MADIYLHDNGIISSESGAAKELYELFQEGLAKYKGKVWLIPSVEIYPGTGFHDLDLLMIGYLEDYQIEIAQYQNISILSFCTTIEIKSHGADGIYRNRRYGRYY